MCLADYCDMMRCDVLATQDPKIVFPETINTDVEIWREASSISKALITPGTREVAKYSIAKHGIIYTNLAPKSHHTSSSSSSSTPTSTSTTKQFKEKCIKSEAPSTNDNGTFIFN